MDTNAVNVGNKEFKLNTRSRIRNEYHNVFGFDNKSTINHRQILVHIGKSKRSGNKYYFNTILLDK